MSGKNLMCPSSTCEEGAVLLGMILPDGTVAYAAERKVVTPQLVQIMRDRGEAERKFRFGGKCVKGGCKQWTGDRCGVIDRVTAHVGGDDDVQQRLRDNDLPECTIRDECRWFEQSGALACASCSLVVTDSREPAEMSVI
jgi:hypothetical protein